MHYYQFNIGDYATHTRHLSPMEDLAYRRILDWYYLHESPLPIDPVHVARLVMLNECLTDVQQVLNEFFTLVEQGWINSRADKEIARYQDKVSKASEAGKASGLARSKPVERPLNKRSTKQELITNNQEPIIKSKDLSPQKATTSKATRLPKDWELPKTWGDWALSEKPNLTVVDVRRIAADFKDYWISNASRAIGKKDDWLATWRIWVRKERDPPKQNSVQEARLSVAEQIMGGRNGNDRQIIELNPRPAIESSRADVPKVALGVWEPDASKVAGN